MQHSLGGMLMPSCLQRPGAAQATPGWVAVNGPPGQEALLHWLQPTLQPSSPPCCSSASRLTEEPFVGPGPEAWKGRPWRP